MRPAIRVDQISKLYRLGERKAAYSTLRESLTNFAIAPYQNLRRALTRSELPTGEERISGDAFWALRDVSFDVQQGEVVGIIGRNGAGKSTLLKLLSRITEPTSGRIELRGRVSSLLEVGTGFHPELTGRENIHLNGSILGMRHHEIDRKFDEIVAFAGVEDFLDTPVKRYSSGMYVRLAFAVAAHLEPEILIVDEVLAVGDAEFQKKCLGKMHDVARGGRTVLFVSHNMGAIDQLCSRVILLKNGQHLHIATKRAAIEEYLHELLPRAGVDGVLYSPSTQAEHPTRIVTKLISSDGDALRHGERACFHWHLNPVENFQYLFIVLGFAKPNGSRVLTVEWPVTMPDKSHSACYITEIPQLPLSPGSYNLEIAIRPPTSSSLEHIDNACRIEVAAGPSTPPHLLNRSGSSDGDVRLFLSEATLDG